MIVARVFLAADMTVPHDLSLTENNCRSSLIVASQRKDCPKGLLSMALSSNIPATGGQPEIAVGGPLSALERVAAAHAAEKTRVGADWHPPDGLVEQIKQLTQSIFPGEVKTEIDCDPSEPDDPWMNFWVVSNLERSMLNQLRDRWHAAVGKLGVEDETRFRLLIIRP